MILSCVINRIEAIRIARICNKSVFCIFIDITGKSYDKIMTPIRIIEYQI